MNSFVCFALIAAAITLVSGSPAGSSSAGSGVVGVDANQEAAEGQQQQSPIAIQSAVDLTRLRKAAGYGGGYGASIPAPPCPKNYLFSCQPNLSPVPCSAPAPSYGSQGAYSAPVPTYVTPVRSNYGVPQTYTGSYLPQGLGYNNNQYYQY